MSTSGSCAILRCDFDGIVRQVVVDRLGITSHGIVGRSFYTLVTEDEAAQGRTFISSVLRDCVVFDCILTAVLGGRSAVLRFDGTRLERDLLISAKPVSAGMSNSQSVFEAFSVLNNRIVNRQRELARVLTDAAQLAAGFEGVGSASRPASIAPSNPGFISSASRPFSEREQEVVAMLVEGCSNRLIGERLGIAESAVKARLRTIYRKLGVGSRPQAITSLFGNRDHS